MSIDYRCGIEEFPEFSMNEFKKATDEILIKNCSSELFSYSNPQGVAVLRETIAAKVALRLGITCKAENVMITSGSLQSVSMILEMQKRNQNYLVALENPGYTTYAKRAKMLGMLIHSINVSSKELDVSLIAKKMPQTLFITPRHQFPIGIRYTKETKSEIIAASIKHGTLIVEDDFSSYLDNEKETTLYSDMQGYNILYLGTFSKSFLPGLRLAYIIGDVNLIQELCKIKWFYDRHSSVLLELILNELINNGYYSKYCRKKACYWCDRFSAMKKALFCLDIPTANSDFGTSIWIDARLTWERIEQIRNELSLQGISTEMSSYWYTSLPTLGGMRLSCRSVFHEEFAKSITLISQLIKERSI